MRGVLRLVLTLEDRGKPGGKATENEVSGIDDEPLAFDFAYFGVIGLHRSSM